MFFLHTLALVAAVSAPPTPEQYYARALGVMESLPQPAYETYDVTMAMRTDGVAVSCVRGNIQILMGSDKTTVPKLNVAGEYALQTDAAAVMFTNGTICPTNDSIFKPQWGGVHDWMRYGISAPPQTDMKTPVQSDVPSIRTIATVTAVSPGAYDIAENGSAPCPNGMPGHALHLIARHDPTEHPLTDVIVDTQTMRFCSMRFNVVGHASLPGVSVKGTITLDFGNQGGYWGITSGHAQAPIRMLGISVGRLDLDLTYSNVQYPPTLPHPIPALARH